MTRAIKSTKRAALLARVSSQSQGKADRLGIPVQLETGRTYAERMGFEVCGEYVDEVSGASESREGLYRLLTEADQFDIVIIYDLTRLARSEELSHRFLRLLQEAGLEVHSSTRGLISKDIQTSIEIALSAEERRKIYQRTTSARIAIARRGELPNAMQALGYTNVKRQAVIIPSEAELAYRIFQMSASGIGFNAIARTLQEEGVPTATVHRGTQEDTTWSAAAVSRIVRNTIYKGIYTWHHTGSSYEIAVPAIVSEELWAAAQKARSGPRSRLHFPLSGHLFCGLCGARVSSRRTRRRRRPNDNLRLEEYYRCNTASMPKFRGSCPLPQMSRKKLEPLVDTELRRIMTDRETLRHYLELERPPDPAQVTERAHLLREDEQWLEAFRQGAIDATELAGYRREIKVKLRKLEASTSESTTLPFAEYHQAASSMELQELLEFASVNITIRPDELHFRLG